MKTFTTIAFLILVNSYIYTQQAGNYIPMIFEGLQPIWTHASVDSTIIDHLPEEYRDLSLSFDGYSHLWVSDDIERKPLIDGDYLYIVSRTRYDIDVSGGLIEKIDMRTGEKIWQNTFDLRTSSYREFIERTIIKEDTLMLINYKITVPDSPVNYFPFVIFAGFGGEGVLKIRKYNTLTGNLISEETANQFNPNVKFLQVGPDDSAQVNPIENDLLEVIQFTIDREGIELLFDTINYQGLLVNAQDTVFSSLENADWENSWFYLDDRVKKSSDGIIYWIDAIVPNDGTPRHNAYLEIIDGKETKRVSLNELPLEKNQIARWYLEDVAEDYLMLRIGYFHEEFCDYIVLDLEGNFIQILKTDYSNRQFPFRNQKGDFVSMSFGGQIDGRYSMNFHVSDGDYMNTISNFSLDTPDYSSWPIRLYPLENGDYLAEIFHTQNDPDGSGHIGRFYNYMRLSPESIGLETVNTKNTLKQNLNFSIFPNPSHDKFMLDFDQNICGQVTIFNSVGTMITQIRIDDINNHLFHSHNLSPGTYFVEFKNDQYFGIKKLLIID